MTRRGHRLVWFVYENNFLAHYGRKQPRIQTAVLGHSLVRSLVRSFTRLLAPDCSLRSRPPLRSLVRSLAHFAHFAHSLARETVND